MEEQKASPSQSSRNNLIEQKSNHASKMIHIQTVTPSILYYIPQTFLSYNQIVWSTRNAMKTPKSKPLNNSSFSCCSGFYNTNKDNY